jgi:hypothetical protein
MNERTEDSRGEYVLRPARSVSDDSLISFGAAIWPHQLNPKSILSSWWRRAAPECAVAAVHQPSGTMAGLCCGRPCQWVIGRKTHPAVSICDWYVHPAHAGRLLGRRLLRRFEASDQLINAISISDVACAYIRRLGWIGPYPSDLMVMPLPHLGRACHRVIRPRSEIEFQDHSIDGIRGLGELSADLDNVEVARGADALPHMRRGSDDWSWRLSIYPDRVYRFSVARRRDLPVGYVVVRPMATGRRGMGPFKGAVITDLVAVNDDHEILKLLGMKAVSVAAELGVAIALFATTSSAHRRALTAVGFLSSGFPVLGSVIKRRAPVFMWSPRGPGEELRMDRIEMTFADSTIDLDL